MKKKRCTFLSYYCPLCSSPVFLCNKIFVHTHTSRGVARIEHLGGPSCNRNLLNIILKSIGYKIISPSNFKKVGLFSHLVFDKSNPNEIKCGLNSNVVFFMWATCEFWLYFTISPFGKFYYFVFSLWSEYNLMIFYLFIYNLSWV